MAAVAILLLVLLLLAGLAAGTGVWALQRSRVNKVGPSRSAAARSHGIDAFALGEPWRHYVNDARKAQNRFHEGLVRAQDGPVKERLVGIGQQVDAAVVECWETARRGDELRVARRRIETSDIERRVAEATRSSSDDDASLQARDAAERTLRALESQIESADRMDSIIEDATTRLRLLQAQLDEAVARSVELSVHTGETSQLSTIGSDIENVLIEMKALHEALDETEGLGGTAGM